MEVSQRRLNIYPMHRSDEDTGYTNENIYLRWSISKGMDVLEAYKKFGCLVKVGATECRAMLYSNETAIVKVIPGRIFLASLTEGQEFLAKEHGIHLTKYGYILNNLGQQLRLAINSGSSLPE